MKRIKLRIWIVNAGVCLLSAAAFAGETPFDKMQLKGRTDKENPIAYKVGEPIVFTLRTDGLDAVPTNDRYRVRWERTGDDGKYTRLYFEMNRLPDADGNYHDHATPQLKLNGRDENGKLAFGGWRVPMYKRGGWAYRADNDPETWETVWIGIDKGTVPDHFRKIISIAVQFQMMPAEHSGLAFRNFRFEEAE